MRYCCPNCGYIDRSQWMQNRWRSNVYFIHVEFSEDILPEVLEAYKEGRTYYLGKDYAYRLTYPSGKRKGGIIERILLEEAEAFGFKSAFHQPREPVDHDSDPSITKLSDYKDLEIPNDIVSKKADFDV